jgi:hypothetical protein
VTRPRAWKPQAAQPQMAPPAPPPEAKGRKGRKKEEKAAKAPKPPKASRQRSSSSGLLSLSDRLPNRQEMEREAAAELTAAIAPSLDLLRRDVPDAASPDDAYRAIESKLGPAPPDRDAGLPSHPIYKGDALVYTQLKRHYGDTSAVGSFWRSWRPGQD